MPLRTYRDRSDFYRRVLGLMIIFGAGVLIGFSELQHVQQMSSSVGVTIFALLPFIISIGLIGISLVFWRSRFDGDEILRIAGWVLLWMLVIGTLATWTIIHQNLRGGKFIHAQFVVVNNLSVGGIIGIIFGWFDVTRLRYRQQRNQDLENVTRQQKALAQMFEISSDSSLQFDEKIQRILGIGCEYMDMPYGFLTTIDENIQQMEHTIGDHEFLQPKESVPLEKSYCRKTIRSNDVVGIEDVPSELGENDPAYERFGLSCYVGTKILVGDELFGTICFAASDICDSAFTSAERQVVKLLGQWAGYEIERQRFQDRLRELHRISQRLLLADTTDEVAEIAVGVGKDHFNLPLTACWEYDSGADALRPLAETDKCLQIVGDLPVFTRGDTPIWESFDSDEVNIFEDVTKNSNVYNPEMAVRTQVHIPLGGHGVIISAANEPRSFDEIDIESLRLLGTLVTEAMTAAERDEMLVERGETLQQHNDRLDQFAHVVAHDLRNPLAGAVSSLEIARETNEKDFFDRVEQSHDRMDDLIEELLDIASGDREQVNKTTVSLKTTVEEAWSYIDPEEATLSVVGDLGEVQMDQTRLLQLFGNLFRNSVEHGGGDVTVEVGLLADNDGFYVADDGVGLTDEIRTALHEFGQVDSASGTGIGMASVTDIVEAHGWKLSIPDVNDGTRFEIRTGR